MDDNSILAMLHLDSEIEDLKEEIKRLKTINELTKINIEKKKLYLEKLNIESNN